VSIFLFVVYLARKIFSSEEEGQFLARQHAGTPHVARWQLVRYSVSVGKAGQADLLESSLFERWRK
jgi:hypothetical protein